MKYWKNQGELVGVKPVIEGLYYLGNWPENWLEKCVAVVGSRQMTAYGNRVVEMLIPALVEEGKIIVSGGMYGVDETAHEMTLKCGGKTVAVLGWGIKQELADFSLGKRIVESGGIVVSEWADQKGALWTFPQRNRIVAAMCKQVYVVEAGEKSGSLITAELARKMGQEIWAVPGPITSRVSAGTNKLLAEGIAKMWLPKNTVKNRSTNMTDVCTLLQNEPLEIDDLVRKLGRPIDVVSAELMQLQLQGVIEEKAGKYWWRG